MPVSGDPVPGREAVLLVRASDQVTRGAARDRRAEAPALTPVREARKACNIIFLFT